MVIIKRRMLLERLRRYAVEPLYNNMCYTDRPEVVIPYAIAESEKRILQILSVGQGHELHARIEGFPWREFEELLGEHIQHAIIIAHRRRQVAKVLGKEYEPCVFDMYERHRRIDYAYLARSD